MLQEIKALCKDRGITVQGLALHFGWGANSINRWDDNKPSVDKVIRVADYFGVSMDYLCDRTEHSIPASNITIMRKARNLDENGLKTVNYIIDSEIRRMDEIAAERANSANIIPIWRSLQPASAGRGFYLSADEFETILVRKTPETQAAAFAVPVSGDSMEPKYHDGDVLLVGREKSLKKGQIGVFVVDGQGYVKQIGDGVLVSINKAYDPIPITDETRCFGNVIGKLNEDDIV